MSNRQDALQRRDAPAPFLPLEFELERSGRRVRGLLAALVLFVAFLLAILAIAPIRGVVVAHGVVKPAGETVALHHEQGGVIDALLTEKGAVVEAGEPLLRLRAEPVRSELAQLEVREAHLRLRRQRLDALVAEAPLVMAEAAVEVGPGVLANERQLFESDRAAFAMQVETHESQLESRRIEAEARELEAESAGREIAALTERRNMIAALVAAGAVARADLLDLDVRLAETEQRHAAVQGQAASARRAMIEIAQESRHFVVRRRTEWSAELAQTLLELDELGEQIRRHRQALHRLTIRAPADAVVMQLAADGAGGAVPPGGLAAELVPIGRQMVAEVRITPDDIGHVAVGDPAKVRLSTFDPELYGEITGEIIKISPSAFTQEDGTTYYSAEVSLIPPPPESNPKEMVLLPGMTLVASVVGVERSVLGYLGKPFRRAVETAFTER